MKFQKLILIFIFFSFSSNLIAQTNFSRGYQKGWEEGYCYDKSYGCITPTPPLPPYPSNNESFDSFKDGYLRGLQHGQAEPDRVKNIGKSSYKPEPRDFGKYKKPINTELMREVLVSKESQLRNAPRRNKSSYQLKNEWVNRQIHPLLKKFSNRNDENYKKTLKYSKKLNRKHKNEKAVNINSLSDGWYEAITKYTNDDGITVSLDRYVYINNNRIKKYVGNGNLFYSVKEFIDNGNFSKIKYIEPGGFKSSYTDIYIYNDKQVKKLPEFDEPYLLMFYTTDNITSGEIAIFLKDENKWGELYTSIISVPKCSQNTGVVRFPLKPGKYEYWAYDKTRFWEGEIELKKSCTTLRLH